jgi:ornithine carbamoyltransferase
MWASRRMSRPVAPGLVPGYGLTDQWHPTQSLCDVSTIAEHTTKSLPDTAVADER